MLLFCSPGIMATLLGFLFLSSSLFSLLSSFSNLHHHAVSMLPMIFWASILSLLQPVIRLPTQTCCHLRFFRRCIWIVSSHWNNYFSIISIPDEGYNIGGLWKWPISQWWQVDHLDWYCFQFGHKMGNIDIKIHQNVSSYPPWPGDNGVLGWFIQLPGLILIFTRKYGCLPVLDSIISFH